MAPWAGATDGSAGLTDGAADGRARLAVDLGGWGPCSPPPGLRGTLMPPLPSTVPWDMAPWHGAHSGTEAPQPWSQEKSEGLPAETHGARPPLSPSSRLSQAQLAHVTVMGWGTAPPGQVQPPSWCKQPCWWLGWRPSPGAAPKPQLPPAHPQPLPSPLPDQSPVPPPSPPAYEGVSVAV